MFAIIRAKIISDAEPVIEKLMATQFFGRIIVVLSDDEGKSIESRFVGGTIVEHIVLPAFGWSKALNLALQSIRETKNEENFVMMVSTTVELRSDQIQGLVNSIRVADASCSYALFADREEKSYRVPRNTLILWNKKILDRLGPFDESLDAGFGMEDYDMVLRAYRDLGVLPYLGAIDVLVQAPSSLEMKKKLSREEYAMNLISNRYDKKVLESMNAHLNQQLKLKSAANS